MLTRERRQFTRQLRRPRDPLGRLYRRLPPSSILTVAWPTGEFGGMGLEGMVRLGHRRELDVIADPAERERRFAERVAQLYERGKALNAASLFEIDDVIDPADTRFVIAAALRHACV
ncbi:MAG TPA: hypothetical protein VMI73_19435 [Trebonia sp.]|nr:hypothetical protein [Trebonia sp.]